MEALPRRRRKGSVEAVENATDMDSSNSKLKTNHSDEDSDCGGKINGISATTDLRFNDGN